MRINVVVNLAREPRRQVSALLPQEQSLIVQAVEANEHLVRLDTEELAKLCLLKQGLMQDLLSGRVRVPIADYNKDVVAYV